MTFSPPTYPAAKAKSAMVELIEVLYPICRSITGDGVRQTLRILQREIPLTIHEVPSGTRVFDWTVPKEWNIRGAYIKSPCGEKIADFDKSNLHVVNYSVPIRAKLSLQELKSHLFTLPDKPQWIPYRTSYYQETWGFCLSHEQLLGLTEGDYEVVIDSSLQAGHLSYGEWYLPGETAEEVLISCHVCHPSLCNDNLSGIAVAVALAKSLATSHKRRLSYRVLFIPGTIGSITWLALNPNCIPLIRHGFVISGVGDRGSFTYKKSRRGNSDIDRAFAYVASTSNDGAKTIDFFPYGYDERQYCSPGFDLPVGCVMRTPFGHYPEYHTSADNLELIKADALEDSFHKCAAAVDILENNRIYLSQNPQCEPQLGKRGLYQLLGGNTGSQSSQMALLWVLNLSDGHHDLLDIAGKANLSFAAIKYAAETLHRHDLLRQVDG